MTFKTVLFAMGADRATDQVSTLLNACDLTDIHRTVLLMQVAPSLPISIEVPLSDQWMDEITGAREQAIVGGRTLEEALKEAGLTAEVQVVVCERTEIEDIAGIRARYADLSVACRSFFGDQDMFFRVLGGLLFRSARPVLTLSAETPTTNLSMTPQTIMVAWDGGLPASRAVGFALEMLRQANDVHIVCVDPRRKGAQVGEAPGWDLANYLSRHHVNVTVTELTGGGLSVDTVLSRHAMEIGAQLVVMGGYGHSRLRERILGGTTQAMVDHAGLPILLAH